MNLIVAVLMTFSGVFLLVYYPFFKKELEKKVNEGSITSEAAESDRKKVKLGAILIPPLGIVLLAIEFLWK